jgi:hypothetical protein
MNIRNGPRVSIDAAALETIWHWTALARGEFSCLGVVDDDLGVHDVQLFDQVCTPASTDLDQQALARFLVDHQQPELVRAWIHSHGNLSVFWSQQDDACIEGLANESFLVSIVVNKRRDLRCRIDIFQPTRLTLDEVPVDVRVPRYDLKAESERLFRQHVTEVQAAPMPPTPWMRHFHGIDSIDQGRPMGRRLPGVPVDDDELDLWGGP